MIYFLYAEDQEDLAELVPLVQAYGKINNAEPEAAVMLIMKIVTEVDRGVVIKAMDKGLPIGYVMGTIARDLTGSTLNILGIYADKIGNGKLLLEKIEEWARDIHDVHLIRSVTRQNPEAMARLFDARITGYVLEKEF